ncbi:MAG TPA: hypothetical protein VII02_08480 [Gemmatimonadaceae bacterium]
MSQKLRDAAGRLAPGCEISSVQANLLDPVASTRATGWSRVTWY